MVSCEIAYRKASNNLQQTSTDDKNIYSEVKDDSTTQQLREVNNAYNLDTTVVPHIKLNIKLLQGVWAISEETGFIIDGDSVFSAIDLENGGTLFRIKEDSLIIDFGEFTVSKKILKLSADSLITKDEFNGIVKYHKRK